ncbi:carboxypeptidase-like regulatory domain-containing protein [Olivibacter domesticus]|uniref:Carboxypeptidase regulatory-like domain-containing protein n=1 Tax=Olivibacter domesticus TaxID=407022 RepID=A0A1H7IAN1_OLID1|nr:carboxypeptidase-like regulatory domain-containing protein [Olivibacter domesticus]SEK59539.1 Carboxypeptidase regulatory-like domain-containing protein [Olivibacter domesticus]
MKRNIPIQEQRPLFFKNATNIYPGSSWTSLLVLFVLFFSVVPAGAKVDPSRKLRKYDWSSSVNNGQQWAIRGTVRDSSGRGLCGSLVRVSGSTVSTLTGKKGEFTLATIPPGFSIEISHNGFESRELVIGRQTYLEIILIADE